MKLAIDTDRCVGHGRCYTMAPDLFEDDYRGYGQVIADSKIDEEAMELMHILTAACPERSISIVEE